MAMSAPPPRRGPLSVEPLFDDLMREIFLRLPPHDPRGLLRAAVGCRSWRGILSDAAFAREYRRFHRAPPMLGFFYDQFHIERRRAFDERYWLPHFVTTATFRLPAYEDRRDWRVLDSRHGLVLFYTPAMDADFVVCDLVTGEELEIHPDSDCEDIMWWEDDDDNYRFENIRCNAAVLCGRDRCDHLNCHGGPFRVALLGSDEYGQIAFATVYSSETREWSDMISAENPNTISNWGHSAVVGNKVYVPCLEDDSVVEYNMGEQKLSVMMPRLRNRTRTSRTLVSWGWRTACCCLHRW
uniref:Uncharacterized protein n=1 Tax=Avena sativa TaxID=4498 RepID=A0ACD5TV11_AVESA